MCMPGSSETGAGKVGFADLLLQGVHARSRTYWKKGATVMENSIMAAFSPRPFRLFFSWIPWERSMKKELESSRRGATTMPTSIAEALLLAVSGNGLENDCCYSEISWDLGFLKGSWDLGKSWVFWDFGERAGTGHTFCKVLPTTLCARAWRPLTNIGSAKKRPIMLEAAFTLLV